MTAYDTNNRSDIRYGSAVPSGEVRDEHVEETAELISASKVQGTSVYNSAGENLGSIHDLMIEKRRGNVAYAVMSFGGFLGIGEKYTPLPWHVLTYDADKGGYNVNLTAEQLRAAPAYSTDELSRFDESDDSSRVSGYYSGIGYPPIL